MATVNPFAGTVSCTTLTASVALVAPALSPEAVTSGAGTALVLSAANGVNGAAGTAGGPATLLGGDGGNGTVGAGGDGGTANLLAGDAGACAGGTSANGGHANLSGGTSSGPVGVPGETRIQGSSSFVPVSAVWIPTSIDTPFFVAARPYRVKAITARVEVAGTDPGAVSALVKKAPSATPIAAGTALAAAINLKGAAATNQSPALAAAAALEIATGDCIGLDFTGILLSAVGCVTVTLTPAT